MTDPAAITAAVTERLRPIPRPSGWTLTARLDVFADADDTDPYLPPMIRVDAETNIEADGVALVSVGTIALDPHMLDRMHPEAFDRAVVNAARSCLMRLVDEVTLQIMRGTR